MADDALAVAVVGGSDGSASSIVESNSSGILLPTATDQSTRSVASTPNRSSEKSNTGGVGVARAFPASPALSTLSKNTSSSGNSSFASATRMSVDDILSSSKLSLGARQKTMRTIVQMASSTVRVENGKQNSLTTTTLSNGDVSPWQSLRPQQTMFSSKSASAALTLQKQQKNPGQEVRKNRLERIQQDVLQRRLLERAKMKLQAPQHDGSVDSGTNHEDESSKQSSVSSKKRHRSQLLDEVTSTIDSRQLETLSSLEDQSKSAIDSPTSRRAKRVRTDTSYPELDSDKTKKDSEIQPSLAPRKSLPQSAGNQSVSITTRNGAMRANSELNNSNNESQSAQSRASPLSAKAAVEPDEIDEPESVQLALHALLGKYDYFIGSSHMKNNTEREESENIKKEYSPWTIVQSLVSVLSHINLFDPSFLESEECQQVIVSLAKVIKSSIRVKWEVMNRNRQGSDDGEILATNEDHLIQLIQVQIWMRMMVWSLERDSGWEFLSRVIALADATGDEAEDNGASKKRKKKRVKSDERRHLKQPKCESARDSLVHDLRLLMELAPYVLPASLNFSQWLKDTLTFGFRQPIPEYGAELFDHFEIEVTEPIALKRSGTDNSRQSERSAVSNSPVKTHNDNGIVNGESPTKQLMEKRHQSQQAYFESLAEEEKLASIGADEESATATGSFSTVTSVSRASSSVRGRVDPLLLKTSVSLTASVPAKTSNPFLKGSARGVYVGSHLGSKLSNITSLFREVKAPAKPVEEKKVKLAASKKLDTIPSSTMAGVSASASAAQNKRKARLGDARSRISSSPPEETPLKRPRQSDTTSRTSSTSMLAIEETPVRPIIDETPAKKPNPTARTRLRLRDELPLVRNSIVAETPQQQTSSRGGHIMGRQLPPSPYKGDSIIAETPQQQPTRRDGAAPSSVLPMNLWHRQDVHQPLPPPPPPRQSFRQPKGNNGRQQQRQNQQHHLSPINLPRHGSSAPLSYGLSPMPNQEDMATVLAMVAESAARKEKGMK